VHVHAAVARVLEVEHARKRQPVALDQPVDGVRRLVRDVARDLGVALPVRLGNQVAVQQLGRVVEQAGGPLQLRAGGRNLAARERGVAGRLRVALEYQHLGAALVRGQRGDRAACAGPDDEHLRAGGERSAL
jgi:hypothetical protein